MLPEPFAAGGPAVLRDLSTLADKYIQGLGGSNGVPVRRLQKGRHEFWGGVEWVGKMVPGTRPDAFKPLRLRRIEFGQTWDRLEKFGWGWRKGFCRRGWVRRRGVARDHLLLVNALCWRSSLAADVSSSHPGESTRTPSTRRLSTGRGNTKSISTPCSTRARVRPAHAVPRPPVINGGNSQPSMSTRINLPRLHRPCRQVQ